MSGNLDNYAAETAPLFKLLRTPAFRFIYASFNHYDLLRRLEGDLRQRFPHRPFLKINTQSATYVQISEAFQSLGSGFLWLRKLPRRPPRRAQQPRTGNL